MGRDVKVYLLPAHFEPADLAGTLAVVIDVLRASTTMVTAIGNGADGVVPCADAASARAIAARLGEGGALLGGERGGVRIEGFDLDNSPAAYAPQRVAGRTVVFTTTNGTAALLRSSRASRVLIGALINRDALVRELARDGRPVRLVCAGTDGRATCEDLLCAGAIAARFGSPAGPIAGADDVTTAAIECWSRASSSAAQLRAVLRASRGGRNLVRLGFERDIDDALRLDSRDVVAEFFASKERVLPVRLPGV